MEMQKATIKVYQSAIASFISPTVQSEYLVITLVTPDSHIATWLYKYFGTSLLP